MGRFSHLLVCNGILVVASIAATGTSEDSSGIQNFMEYALNLSGSGKTDWGERVPSLGAVWHCFVYFRIELVRCSISLEANQASGR